MKLAFTTFAILRAPYGNPEVQEFDDRTPDVFAEAERSPGFLDRAVEVSGRELSNFERDWGKWGRFCVPRFYTLGRETGTDQRASSLSVWRDIDSVRRFVYAGLHRSALRKRHEWFLPPEWPTYAMWWIGEADTPTWEDACRRLERLHDGGPTPGAFDFKRCFDPEGRVVSARPSAAAAHQPS